MRGGAKTLLVTAALSTVGCAPGAKMVEIRPIADPSAKLKLGGPQLAQAKAQLALGNIGLAIEAFRVVSREQPAQILSRLDRTNRQDVLAFYAISVSNTLQFAFVFDRSKMVRCRERNSPDHVG